MHILLATDADYIVDEVTAALGDTDTSFTVCREGRLVADLVGGREPDLVILDLQIGTMGGIAVTMELRLDESAGALPNANVLLLLDREVDVHLARRSGADGWLVKPLDALNLKRAATTVAAGESFPPPPSPPTDETVDDEGAAAEDADSTEEEPATAG